MLYDQPLSTRFGTDLIAHIKSGKWDSLDIAVAWVRQSGTDHLRLALRQFLRAGNSVRIVCGIDLHNTTYEGLKELLRLESYGDIETTIHHNEAGSVFHPKLYLFRKKKIAKLIVASNNITEAGLFRNTEAGLEVNINLNSATCNSTLDALRAWSDTSTGFAKTLTRSFLKDLLKNGYVKHEKTVKNQLRKAPSSNKKGAKLFASRGYSAPSLLGLRKTKAVASSKTGPRQTTTAAVSTATTQIGRVLLMRVRKAHVTDRPTQTQLPKVVAKDQFFGGITVVQSAHDGQKHHVNEAFARGIVNTLKLEIPEMRKFKEPVIRFERTVNGIVYAAYDGTTPAGKQVLRRLRQGFKANPPASFATKRNNLPKATWWRFI